MKPISLSAFAALALCAAPAHAQWSVYPPFLAPGHAGIVVLDLDADGVDEAVVSGYGGMGRGNPGTQFLAVVDHSPANGHRVVKQRHLNAGEKFTGRVQIRPGSGAATIVATTYTTTGQNFLTSFSGPGLARGSSVPVGRFVLHTIADVDADGVLDAIGVTAAFGLTGNAEVRDLATGAVKWTDKVRTAAHVAVAQLDGDVALELIYGNLATVESAGYVVDGITQQVDWTWTAGFKGSPITGNFDTDPTTTEFAIVEVWESTRVFGAPKGSFAEINQFETGHVTAWRAHDIDSDGIDEIVLGGGQWGPVRAYAATTGQIRFAYANPSYGVAGLALGNLDLDASVEVIVSAGLTGTFVDVLDVVDTTTMARQWRSRDMNGPHSSVVVADFDADGVLEMAYATYEAEAGTLGAGLAVLDAETGVELRALPHVDDPYADNYGAQLQVANLDADANMEIVIGGGSAYDGRLRVVDGVTLAFQWQTPVTGSVVQAIELVELSGDGIPDIVAAIDRRVRAFSGSNGALLWSSPSTSGVNRLTIAAGEADADTSKEVFLGDGTRFFLIDADTRTFQATYTATAEALGLAIEGSGADCRLVHFDPTQIVRRRCDTLAIDSTRPYAIPSAIMVKPVTDSHGALLLSDGDGLHVQDGATLSSDPVTGLGPILGWRNKGAVMRAGDVTTAYVGAATAVHRVDFVPDTTPSPFDFTDVAGVATDVAVTSDEVTLQEIRVPSPISVDGGSFSVNDGPFQTAPGTVVLGDRVRVRHVSSDDALTAVDTTLDVGGVSGSFRSTTGLIDTTPYAFAFEDVIRARPSQWIPSAPVTLTGFNTPLPISIVAQQPGDGSSDTVEPAYSINGGPYTSSPGMVHPGDAVRVAMMSSPLRPATVSALITIGERELVWNVSTNYR